MLQCKHCEKESGNVERVRLGDRSRYQAVCPNCIRSWVRQFNNRRIMANAIARGAKTC